MKKQIKFKAVVLAVALTLMPAVAWATLPVTDVISNSAQNYSYQNAMGETYSQYEFEQNDAGTGSILQMNATSDYAPLQYDSVLLSGVYVDQINDYAQLNEIDFGSGTPVNRLMIDSDVAMSPSSGELTVKSASPMTLIISGNQSLGAAALDFSGPGSVHFGSAKYHLSDAQSLELLQLSPNVSNVDFYKSNVTLAGSYEYAGGNGAYSGGIMQTGTGNLTLNGDSSTLNTNGIETGGNLALNGTGNDGFTVNMSAGSGTIDYGSELNINKGVTLTNMQNFNNSNGAEAAPSLDIYGEYESNDPSKSSSTINLDGGTLDLTNAQTDEYGHTNINMTSGNFETGTIEAGESNFGLIDYGHFSMTGGNLTFKIGPSDTANFGINDLNVYATKGYSVTGGNVLIDAEKGSYLDNAEYMLLAAKSGHQSVFDPNAVYYVYNGSDSKTIDDLDPKIVEQSGDDHAYHETQLWLEPAPTKAKAPAKAKTPAKASPAPAKAAPAPVKIHVVTPVQEAKGTLVSTPRLTFQQARQASQVLVSSGIVGGGPRGLWFKGMGGAQRVGDEKGANYGLIAGYGWSVGQGGDDVAGVAFSAGQSGMGTGPQDFAKASDYALWTYGTAYFPLKNPRTMFKIAGTLGAGLSSNSISSTALGLPQSASFGGHFVSGEVRASFWDTLPGLDNIIVSPRLSLGYTQSWTNGYRTHGGSFLNVRVHSASAGQLYIEQAVLIGKKFNYRTIAGNHTLFPQVRLGIVQNIGPTPSAMVSSGQVAAQVAGLSYPHTQGMAEVRLDVTSHTKYSKGLSGSISVRQLFGGGASSTEAMAAIKYRW